MEVRVKKLGSALVGMLVLTLAACSSGSAAADAPTAAASSSASATSSQWGILNTSYSDALAIPVQLAVGTMQLDGTENAVTAEQAGELLTLWQGYSSLLSGESPAQEEYKGLQHQIEETLTAAQLQSIAKLELTVDDMGSAMAEMGPLSEARPARSSAGSSSSSSSSSGGFGGGPGGGMPTGGGAEILMMGGPPGGMESTASGGGGADSSAPVSLQATGDINPQLVQAVIAYLQGKLNTAPGN
jgi:hypothetical protein